MTLDEFQEMLRIPYVELQFHGANSQTLDAMDSKEYFTLQQNYVDNDKTAATAAAVERAQALAEAAGDKFARIEYLPRSTCMDTALHHYKGITTFASSNSYDTTLFMGDLGYAINGVNSYLYHSFVAPADSLFGIRYVILKAQLSGHAQLKLLERVTVGEEVRYIYENQFSLPVGYIANETIREYAGADYAPFDNQEALYGSILGKDVDMYLPLTLEPDDGDSSIYGSSFIKSGTVTTGYLIGAVAEKGQ
jgi:uncharacterized membrane protein YfhO